MTLLDYILASLVVGILTVTLNYLLCVSCFFKDKEMAEDEPVFPDSLEGFGYKFNDAGQLRHIESGDAYKFVIKEGDHHYNQKRYNALGDVITELIYEKMEKEHKLKRKYVPVDAEEGEPQSFVFVSEDIDTNTDKLLILIHGSGAVRAGQWARRLIINDCLDSGTQLPYIKWAQENGYAVIVANTNINTVDKVEDDEDDNKPRKIRGNSSPEEHTKTLWNEFVKSSKAKHIAIVAHSYGGVCALELANHHTAEFQNRVFAIALTDSVHNLRAQESSDDVVDFYREHAVNWASASDPLDTPLTTTDKEVPTRSAGTDRHDYTSYSCMQSVFNFITEQYEITLNPNKKRSVREPSDIQSPEKPQQDPVPEFSRGQGEGEESKTDDQSIKPTNQRPSSGELTNQNTKVSTSSIQLTVNMEVRPDPQGSADEKMPSAASIKSSEEKLQTKSEL